MLFWLVVIAALDTLAFVLCLRSEPTGKGRGSRRLPMVSLGATVASTWFLAIAWRLAINNTWPAHDMTPAAALITFGLASLSLVSLLTSTDGDTRVLGCLVAVPTGVLAAWMAFGLSFVSA